MLLIAHLELPNVVVSNRKVEKKNSENILGVRKKCIKIEFRYFLFAKIIIRINFDYKVKFSDILHFSVKLSM